MARYIIDAESDGLLDTVSKIHVIGWHNLDTHKSGVITDYNQMVRFLRQKDMTLVCHNIIRYDLPLFKKILKINPTARIIDTLMLSWYLYPNKNSHGLGAWGESFGVPKPVVEDWSEQPIAVYIDRVVEDVKINKLVFDKQIKYLQDLYNHDETQIKRIIGYLMYKMECAKEQEDIKWKLDVQKSTLNLSNFKEEFERKQELLVEIMPENIIYKTIKKPKVFNKKDGTISKLAENWLSLLADLGLDDDYDEPLKLEKSTEPGNPNSHKQLKDWLYTLGWEPSTFKYEKDENYKVRKIPQVSLPRGEGICESVKLLYKEEPRLEELDMLYVIKHRIGLLSGFLRDVDKEGYIKAKISGLTNTLRFKHSVVVNLPKPTGKEDWRDGAHIRGCLIAPEGMTLCGSDMSSLEDRTKQHYMYYFDPKYVESMQVPGFDPHLDLAEFGFEVTGEAMGLSKADVQWFKDWSHDNVHTDRDISKHTWIKKQRADFKTVNYGAVYGVGGPTMSRSTGIPLQQCEILLLTYWKKNWSVKEIAKACKIQTIGKQAWLQNPVSKFWYSLRAMKDRFSTLNQGTGVYCFDRWIMNCRAEGVQMCGQFHDEIVFPVKAGDEQRVTKILQDSIVKVNKELKLNRALDIDVQFGNSYAEIH